MTRDAAVPGRRRLVVRGALLALVAAGVAAGLAVVAVVPPTPGSFYPGCSFHRLTGLHCPGCGLTRGLHSLLNGRLAQAHAYHPLILVLLPLVGVSIARSLWAWAWDAPSRPRRWLRAAWPWYGVTAVLVAFWVLRNVPAYPFTLLAPHELSP